MQPENLPCSSTKSYQHETIPVPEGRRDSKESADAGKTDAGKNLIPMLAEHVIYSAAIAIIVGMFFFSWTGRDHSWIIILCAWAPDADMIANRLLSRMGFTLLFEGHAIYHGAFHTVAVMVIFGAVMAFFLHPFGIRLVDGFFFSVIGFGAHLFEDALVYAVGYQYLWPFSSSRQGIGLLPNIISEEQYFRDFYGIANTEVLLVGLVFLLAAIVVRSYREGGTWVRWYMPGWLSAKLFGNYALNVPAQQVLPGAGEQRR